MTKQEAINLFGSKVALQHALGCTRQLLHGWKDELTQAQEDRVLGAALREAAKRGQTAAELKQSLEALL